MSDTVKLSARLEGNDETNGLDALAGELINDPSQIRVAVIYFDVCKIVDNTDDQTRVPYARIRRFEPLGDVDEISDDLRKLIQKAVEDRTGKAPLPFGQLDGADDEGD